MNSCCLIIGMGKTGKSAYNFLLKKGYMPIFYDDILLKTDVENDLNKFDFILTSPGVPASHNLIMKAKKLFIPVYSATEIMYLLREDKDCKIIGITGTNGKTTVTSMVGHVLGEEAFVCGNIGTPWMEADNKQKRFDVVELSSFELDRTYKFKPNYFLLLNIKPDHLDYHKSFEEYKLAKLKPLNNMNMSDVLIYNGEDNEVVSAASYAACKKYYFSINELKGNGVFVSKDNYILISEDGNEIKLFDISEIKYECKHNIMNILASSLVCYLCGKEGKEILNKLKSYEYEPYRLQKVISKNEFEIFNDSKSTNLASTIAALSVSENNIILLVGGKGKNEKYNELFSFRKKLKEVVAFGEARNEFTLAAKEEDFDNIRSFKTMREAAMYALNNANKGDIVLFSPACASFDEFKSYKDRGQAFSDIVNQLE